MSGICNGAVVKQEEDVKVEEFPNSKEFVKEPARRSRQALFPPGCAVVVSDTLHHAVIEEVGTLDIGEVDRRYKATLREENRTIIVEERNLQWASHTPVWYACGTPGKSTLPGIILTDHKCRRSASGELLYSIRIHPCDQLPLTIITTGNKLKYRHTPLPESVEAAPTPQAPAVAHGGSASSLAHRQSNTSASRRLRPQGNSMDYSPRHITGSTPTHRKPAGRQMAAARASDPTMKAYNATREASHVKPTSSAMKPTTMQRTGNRERTTVTQPPPSKKSAVPKSSPGQASRERQPFKAAPTPSSATRASNSDGPGNRLAHAAQDKAPQNGNHVLQVQFAERLIAPPRALRPHELEALALERRRQNCPRDYVLNETPNRFRNIRYSPQHEVSKALDCVREYVKEFGIEKHKAGGHGQYRNQYKLQKTGGVGPVLGSRCLRWHIQGQCVHQCWKAHDHKGLTENEAIRIENALEPATFSQGPIFPPEALELYMPPEEFDWVDRGNLHMPNHQNNNRAAASYTRDNNLQQQARTASASTPARASNSRVTGIIDLPVNEHASTSFSETPVDTTTARQKRKEKRKRQHTTKVSLLLPPYFGKVFFQSILDWEHDFTTRLEEEFDCNWKLEEFQVSTDINQKRLKVDIEGSDVDKLLECRFEMERILCEKLHDESLRAKFLLDVARLNRLRNPEGGNREVWKMRWPKASCDCYMTEVPINEAQATTTEPTLGFEAASNLCQKLQYRYDISFELYNRSKISHHHRDVPSHVIIWGKDLKMVELCRFDIIKIAASRIATSADQEDDNLF
jgi:hypothetical protein